MVAGTVEKRNRLGHTDLMGKAFRAQGTQRVKVRWLEDTGAGRRVWQGGRYMKGVIRNKFEKVNWDPIMEGGPWAMLKNLDCIPQATGAF